MIEKGRIENENVLNARLAEIVKIAKLQQEKWNFFYNIEPSPVIEAPLIEEGNLI